MGGNTRTKRVLGWIAAAVMAMLVAVFCLGLFTPTKYAAAETEGNKAPARLAAGSGVPVERSVVVKPQALAGDTSWYYEQAGPTYTIKNIPQLIGLSSLVNSGTDTFQGKVVQFPAEFQSLAFLGNSIEPIGTPSHPFEGTFDGGGYTISNLTLDFGNSLSNIGLFGYAGKSATLKNVRLAGGKVEVVNATDGKKISDVGAIAGHLGGSMEGCTSSVAVRVVNDGAAPATTGKSAEDLTTMLNIGGLVGSVGGNLVDCAHQDASLKIESKTNVTDDVPYIAGHVGGIAGYQGDEGDASLVPEAKNCRNTGPLTFTVSGSGGVDRFGQQMYSKSSMVGGIVGYSMGNFTQCSNTAEVQTGLVKSGEAQAGWGASNVGGIVGGLRAPTIAESASATGVVGSNDTDPGYSVWLESKGTKEPTVLVVKNCSNTAAVTGLASVAGIAGSTGAFTQVVACSNTGLIQGTRWNKPCPAGIVGISNGDIAYCYNQGRCFSTTGGGYYASGITALLTTYNISSTPDNLRMRQPEIFGCYVTGSIGGKDTGYRTAVIAGENDGFIHDNCFLPNLTVDKVVDKDVFGDEELHSRLVSAGEDRGTLANNHELSADDMKTGLAVSYLNKPLAQKSDWSVYYVPQAGKFPVLSWQDPSAGTPVSLSSVATGIASVQNPAYSAAFAPIPLVTLSTVGGKVLYQDSDYKVVVSPDAKEVGGEYAATVVGINGYTGELAVKASYTVKKASIGTCTVTAAPAVFNWNRQAPKVVTVFDNAGNEVDSSEYTWRTLANADGSTAKDKTTGKYYDYVNCHGEGYKYDIEVTASDTSTHYTGSTTQAAFRIEWASLMYSPDDDGRTDIPESAKLGNVVFGNQEWDIAQALKTKGFVKIKYTGSEIKPSFKSVSYLGRAMRDGTGKPYYYEPLNYDYMLVYGNPNPEPGKEQDNQCINVTGSKETELGCVTARFTSGGNFDNYTNVFYEITPASIADDVKVTGIEKEYAFTGSPVKVHPTLTYNGMTLKQGTDYTLSYANNTAPGKATVTITGKGNYAGTTTKQFTIQRMSLAKANVSLPSQAYTGKAITPQPVVTLGGKTLASGTDYSLSVKNAKGASVALKNLKAVGKYTATITGKGSYTGSASQTFNITKGKNTLIVKAKNLSTTAKKLKAKTLTFTPLTVKNAKGSVTYKKASGNAKVSVNAKTGKVSVKKGCKKGSYSVKVKVTAKGTASYKSGTKTVSFKVVVK